MNKSILLSIRPEWVLKILTHKKTIEVRKQFPKDYKGWVYIYCTKGKPCLVSNWVKDHEDYYSQRVNFLCDEKQARDSDLWLNGKVVARFWCDKVEEVFRNEDCACFTKSLSGQAFCHFSCLNEEQLNKYFGFVRELTKVGYAIHISKLEIFDRPRELSEFNHYKKPSCESCPFYCDIDCYYHREVECDDIPLTKAPQNYCYVEGDEY